MILCLSVTKWIHLNNGDGCLKRTFKKIYQNLQYGGRFVLEAQPWDSYGKKRKITVSKLIGYCCIIISIFLFMLE